MINKQKLYSISLVSATLILMLVSIAGAEQYVYISNFNSNNVSVIDTANDNVTATVSVGSNPQGVIVTANGKNVYVKNFGDSTVSVIDTAT